MAYGSAELDVAATTTDDWLNAGNNGLDLFSSHNIFLAILMDNAEQPGGDYQFKEDGVAEGGKFKVTVYGNSNATVAGVTRANQITEETPTVPGAGGAPSVATNAFWPWSFYKGIVFDNYQDRIKNRGKARMVDLGNMYLDQLTATFFDVVGTDLLDGAAGTEDKVQSVNGALLNTGVVAGIDQTDPLNAWWAAVQDTVAEVIGSRVIDYVSALASHDTGKKTGIRKFSPDFILVRTDQWAKLMQDMKSAQIASVDKLLRTGAEFLQYGVKRIFFSDRIAANTALILNSTTWTFRYATKMPEPKTPGWVPSSRTPAMWERASNWAIGFGGYSMKHNALLTNKRAS